MTSIARSLIWKECHEQKWRVLSFAIILVSLQAYAAIRDSEVVLALTWTILALYVVFGPVFLAMGAVAGERARGTFDLVRALPVRPSRVMLAKLLVGAAACVAPVATAILFLVAWTISLDASDSEPLRELSPIFGVAPVPTVLAIGFICAGCAVAVFVWAAAAGSRQPTELRAGLAAVLIVAVWGFVILLGLIITDGPHPAWYGRLFGTVLLFSPGGLLAFFAMHPPSAIAIAGAQVLVLAALSGWSLHRFGKPDDGRSRSRPRDDRATTAQAAALGPPRRSRTSALAWKQGRETLPVAVAGLAIVLGLTVLALTGETSSPRSEAWMELAGTSFNYGSLVLGFLVALVVGVGTFSADMQPPLLAFWRSRSIGVTRWFWTKYLTGAAMILLIMHGPVVVIAWLGHDPASIAGDPHLLCVPLAHLASFTIAVWLACSMRHAVYAGVIAFGLTLGLILGPGIEPALERFAMLHVLHELMSLDARGIDAWLSAAALPYQVAMSGVIAITLALAWSSVRSDAALEHAG